MFDSQFFFCMMRKCESEGVNLEQILIEKLSHFVSSFFFVRIVLLRIDNKVKFVIVKENEFQGDLFI
jgi:hypothetical protein